VIPSTDNKGSGVLEKKRRGGKEIRGRQAQRKYPLKRKWKKKSKKTLLDLNEKEKMIRGWLKPRSTRSETPEGKREEPVVWKRNISPIRIEHGGASTMGATKTERQVGKPVEVGGNEVLGNANRKKEVLEIKNGKQTGNNKKTTSRGGEKKSKLTSRGTGKRKKWWKSLVGGTSGEGKKIWVRC